MNRIKWILRPCCLWHIVVVTWRLAPDLGVWHAMGCGWAAVWYWYEIQRWYDEQEAEAST